MRYTQWKTWCVGRNLIDLPLGSTVTYTIEINGDQLKELFGVTPEQIPEIASKRVAELKAQPHETEGSMFLGAYQLPDGGICINQWVSSKRTWIAASEAYLVCRGTQSRVFFFRWETDPAEQQGVVHWNAELASAFRTLEPDEIPQEPGLCGDGFLFLNTPSFREEYAYITASLPTMPPGLMIIFTTATSTPSRKALADNPDVVRHGANNLAGGVEEVRSYDVLRKGRHKVGGINGYEICVAGVTTHTPIRMYSFFWQTPGLPYDYANPIMEMDLRYTWSSNGFRADIPGAFFDDSEGLGIWDDIVNSIRLRPTTA
jgi:hypothetical protein